MKNSPCAVLLPLLFAALLADAAVHGQGAAAGNNSGYLGFEFARGTCPASPDFGYCAVRVPKTWSKAEIELTAQALKEIAAVPLGRQIIQNAQDRGFRILRRYAQYATLTGTTFVPNPTARAVTGRALGSVKGIDLNDAYFRCAGARDHFSGIPGYSVTAMVLLHELFHAVDLQEGLYQSEADAFPLIIGFSKRRDGSWFLVARSKEEVNNWKAFVDRQDRFVRAGHCESEIRTSREFGLRIIKRLPSMQAVFNPGEAFAEVGAHLLLDPRANAYLEPGVIHYFAKRGFNIAR